MRCRGGDGNKKERAKKKKKKIRFRANLILFCGSGGVPLGRALHLLDGGGGLIGLLIERHEHCERNKRGRKGG